MKNTNNHQGDCHVPKYEPLRLIVRAVLQKEEITEQDVKYLTQKAVALEMDPEEFRLLWESLLASKKRYRKGFLFRKQKNDEYITDQFDQDFDETFLTEEERNDKMMSEISFFGKILGGNSVIDEALSLVEKCKKVKI